MNDVNYNEVKAGLEEMRSSLAIAKSSYDKLRTYIAMGNSYILLSDYEDPRTNLVSALLSFDEAEKIVRKIEGRSSAEIETQKGYLFFKLSFVEDKDFNLKKSIEHYFNSIELLKEEAEISKILHVKYNLANSYIALKGDSHRNNLIKAIGTLDEVVKGAFDTGNAEMFAIAKNALGVANLMLAKVGETTNRINLLTKAKENFSEAELFYTKDSYALNYASCENEIGAVLLEIGFEGINTEESLAEAIKHFEQALTIYNSNDMPFDFASIHYNIGISYSKLTKSDDPSKKDADAKNSIEHFEKALEVFTLKDTPSEFARSNYELGMARRNLFLSDNNKSQRQRFNLPKPAILVNRLQRSKTILEKEIENFSSVLKVFNKKENPFTYLTAKFFIGEALYSLGRVEESIAYYEEAERVAIKVDKKLAQEIREIKDNISKLI